MKAVLPVIMVFALAPVRGISPSYATDGPEQITAISGTLELVSVEKQEVYIRNDTRMIKFNADRELCESFKEEINAMVIIHYVKTKDGVLYISSMSKKK